MTPRMPCQRYKFSNNRITLQLVQHPYISYQGNLWNGQYLYCKPQPTAENCITTTMAQWIWDKIISNELVNFATLLPNAIFLGSTGMETLKSLTIQLTPVGNDLSAYPQPSAKKINSFASWMEACNTYLAIFINHSPGRAPQLAEHMLCLLYIIYVLLHTVYITFNYPCHKISQPLCVLAIALQQEYVLLWPIAAHVRRL